MQAPAARIFLSPRARTTILWIVAALVLLFLWEVREILTPFVWAIITAYVLNPVVVFLTRRTGVNRRVWSILVYLLVLGTVILGFSLLGPAISHQIGQLFRDIPAHFRELGKLLGQTQVDILGTRINLNATDEQIRAQLTDLFSQLGRNVLPGALPHLAESVLKLLVYLVATLFLLLEANRISRFFDRFTPPAAQNEFGPVMNRINTVLGAYIRGQLFLVALITVVTYIGLTILGVRYAPLLAIFTGLVEIMPFIGPYIAGATAVLVALTQSTAPFGWTSITLAIAVAIMYTVIRQLEDNFVMPTVIGRIVHLHPLVVIFAALAGSALLGILGLLLAVPIAATIKIIADYIYCKLREEPARTVVMIEREDGWERIASKLREGAILSTAQGAPRPRLLLSVPYAPTVLLDPVQFPRLLDLLKESNADGVISTADPALAHMADEQGIGPQRIESATQEASEIERETARREATAKSSRKSAEA